MAESLYTTEAPSGTTQEFPGPTLGTVIVIAVAGQITALKGYIHSTLPSNASALPFILYDATTQAQLARATANVSAGWNTVTLTTPVSVTAGQRVIAAIYTADRYAYEPNGFQTTGRTVGDLTAPATGSDPIGNGRFHTGSEAYPEGTFGGHNYFTDVVFTPSATTTPYTKTFTESYRVLNAVSSAVTERYRVFGSYSLSFTEAYRVLNAQSSALSERYRVLNAQTLALSETYRVFNALTSSLTERYNVLAGTAASITLNESYRVFGAFSTGLDERYRVLNAFSITLTEAYRVLLAGSLTLSERYRIFNVVTRSLVERYTVGDAVPPVIHPTALAVLSRTVRADLAPLLVTAYLEDVS